MAMVPTDNVIPELYPVLTSEQARALLQVPLSTFYRLLDEGHLPAFKIGRQWRFRQAELLAWIQRQERSNQWRVDA